MFLELTEGIALLFMICVVRNLVIRRWRENQMTGQVLSGLLFGSVCVIGMLAPFEFYPGAILDGRTVILSTAGLFGGPVAAFIAAFIAVAFRIWLGGVGVWVGCGMILTATILGLVFRFGWQRNWISKGLILYAAMGFTIHVIILGVFLMLPSEVRDSIELRQILIYLAVFTLGNWMLGFLLEDGESHLDALKALHISERRSRAIFDQTLLLLGRLSPDGRLLDANKTALQFANVALNDVEGKYVWDTPWWSHSKDEQFKIKKAVKKAALGEVVQYEASHLDGDGKIIPMEFSLRPVFDSFGVVEILIPEARDISIRRNLEEQLTQSQRTEAVGQLTGGVSHHFNNLLAIMIGHGEALQGMLANNPAGLRHIQPLMGAIDRASFLVQRMLSFSRQQTLFPISADIPQLLENEEDRLNEILGDNIHLKIRHDEELWPVVIDPAQFALAVVNLISNARNAVKKGAVIEIETSNITWDKFQIIQFEDVEPGDYVKVVIRDKGCGMTRNELEKAFVPFFTTHEIGEGSGLGLSMVYGFVKQSNGHISINSVTGRGTDVFLFLPRFQEKVTPREFQLSR